MLNQDVLCWTRKGPIHNQTIAVNPKKMKI